MYLQLRETIESIKLIDNHAHPGSAEFFETVPPTCRIMFAADVFKTPEESSGGFAYQQELHYDAYQKLYGFSREAIQDMGQREQIVSEYENKRKNLRVFIDEIMEAAGIDLVMANFIIPDSLTNKANVCLVPTLDPLIFPFNNAAMKKRVLSMAFLNTYEFLLDGLKKKFAYSESDFAGYLHFIDQVIDGYVKDKVAAFKFTIAYARSTAFRNIPISNGPNLYEQAKANDSEAYEKLQDLLVWYIMRRITRLDMAVQFHFAVTDNYIAYFDPMNLANMLEDEELKDAKIVILHGAYPRFDSAELLALGGLTVNNVCIDISGRIMFWNHPKIIAKMLRSWLEKPALWDKILYGSDALLGERYLYTCARTARDSVYYALESMIEDGIIDETLAMEIARKILRENALRIYKLG